MVRAGRRHDILLDHDAADVVAAESKPKLAGFQAWRDPGGLDILDILQVNARNSEHLQVFYGRRFFLNKTAERRVFTLEKPGDEGRESAGVLLDPAHNPQMIDPVLNRFPAPE